jgi:TM2 domain-containing membrane protein YozV
MLPTDPIYTAHMTESQRAWFYAEYEQARKEEIVGFLFALLLGTFGIHHFYLRRSGLGILYLCFFWTGVPAILGFIECFLMPGRVRAYNAAQAAFIAGQILAQPSPGNGNGAPPSEHALFTSAGAIPSTQPCPSCGKPIDPSATFCPHCGTARATSATTT